MEATVFVGRGTYELEQPFRLGPEDSNTEYVGDHATISGGRVISGFHLDSQGWWTVTLPEVKAGTWRFSQLFVNGQRRYRPRFPKVGYYNIAAEVPPSDAAKGHGFDRFGFRSTDIDRNWHNLEDVELLCFHIWDMSRMQIGSIDPRAHVVTTAAPTGYDAGWANFPKGNRYIAENVREALYEPGEWYVDNKSGELTYIPLLGETIENTTVVAPKIDRLLEIEGDTAQHRYVEHLTFRNLSFEYTN